MSEDGNRPLDPPDADLHNGSNGNGSHPEEERSSPMDPLLADPPTTSRGNGAVAAGVVATEATIIEAPPSYDEPELDEPVVETVVVPVPQEQVPPTAKAPRQTQVRRQRARPALPLLRRRPRVRKVTRIVRKVDAWGVFKISVVFYVILYIILMVAGILLWNLANTTGTVANVEGFARDLFGLKTFQFDGEKLFRASWVLGAILVVAGTGLNVTLAVLFNLISDLVGGVRVSVLEEEVILRERPVMPRRTEVTVDTTTVAEPEGPLFPAPGQSDLPPPEAVDADAPAAGTV